jgi:hypothetical protein
MFNLGPVELMVLVVAPFSGLAAAGYLTYTLRRTIARGRR